jgi:hypothetical protein
MEYDGLEDQSKRGVKSYKGLIEMEKKYVYLLVSPSNIIGMKLLWNLLPIYQDTLFSNNSIS